MAAEERDPLGFFAADGGSSSEDEQEDRERTKGLAPTVKKLLPSPGNPLPRPEQLFQTVRTPAFLTNPLNRNIDWSSRVLRAPEEPPKEFKVWKTNAVPPPESYQTQEKRAPPPEMDRAIKWSGIYQDNGDDAPQSASRAKFLPDEEPQEDPAAADDDQDKSSSAKKRKVQ
ncbi:UPF0690 protein C1orf52 homolog [Spea bombifrons]|uniref:UPF0690 protein C1orf52 homolog n=1 Tax=Spea bombifrons TaxID=233779 RepID=UPI0023491A23|nr:UPF0690 protein C1orf52 homolog [Spea bombifrons]